MEADLLRHYPKTDRTLEEPRTNTHREVAKRFDREFFDGNRQWGYGGYEYNPRFWRPVVPDFKDHFYLKEGDSVLDVGCAKGFMLYDMWDLLPDLNVRGIDISEYAIQNAKEEMKPNLSIGNAKELPFADNSFDVVISINTIHNLPRDECWVALQEIERVKKRGSFIIVDAYRTAEEKRKLLDWNLTAETIMHVEDWKFFFKEAGYTGDYYWFIP